MDIFLIFAQNIEAVLTSTYNLCFGAKIRKIGIPLQTPVLLYKKWGLRGYSLHGHVFMMKGKRFREKKYCRFGSS